MICGDWEGPLTVQRCSCNHQNCNAWGGASRSTSAGSAWKFPGPQVCNAAQAPFGMYWKASVVAYSYSLTVTCIVLRYTRYRTTYVIHSPLTDRITEVQTHGGAHGHGCNQHLRLVHWAQKYPKLYPHFRIWRQLPTWQILPVLTWRSKRPSFKKDQLW